MRPEQSDRSTLVWSHVLPSLMRGHAAANHPLSYVPNHGCVRKDKKQNEVSRRATVPEGKEPNLSGSCISS